MCALDVRRDAELVNSFVADIPSLETTSKPSSLSLITEYRIIRKQASESAWVFFIEDKKTYKPLVAKVLRPFEDSRYHLRNLADRQQCQLEALRHNRIFTPHVYLGLAKLYNQPVEEEYILLGSIIEHPSSEDLEPDAEYALIMERLPDEFRLDQLFKGDKSSFPYLLQCLTSHVVYLQKNFAPTLLEEDCACWGSYATLKNKLEENLSFFSLIQDADSSFRETIYHLSTELRELFTEERFAELLEQRIHKGAIKRCHGDIKSLNLWIVFSGESQEVSVKLLDAIDFNPLFNCIDILSDFAMLVIDVWVRTQSDSLADDMVTGYFEQIGQNDPDTRMLFTYYLIEKAIVAATINILFDNQRVLGLRLLDLAQKHLQRLTEKELCQLAY